MNRNLAGCKGVIITIALLLCSASVSFADIIWVPMPTKVEMFKQLMKEKGLNLYGGDESDGFVEDQGTKIKIVTYKSVEDKDLDAIKDCAVQAMRQ